MWTCLSQRLYPVFNFPVNILWVNFVFLCLFVYCNTVHIPRRPNCPSCSAETKRRDLIRLFLHGCGNISTPKKTAPGPASCTVAAAAVGRPVAVGQQPAKITKRRTPLMATPNNTPVAQAAPAGQQAQAINKRRRLSTIPFNSQIKSCLLCNKTFISAEIDDLCNGCRRRLLWIVDCSSSFKIFWK